MDAQAGMERLLELAEEMGVEIKHEDLGLVESELHEVLKLREEIAHEAADMQNTQSQYDLIVFVLHGRNCILQVMERCHSTATIEGKTTSKRKIQKLSHCKRLLLQFLRWCIVKHR